MTAYPDDADGAVLTQLALQGVDMSEPLVIEFAVNVPDKKAAKAVASALGKQGYDTEVDYDEGEPNDEGVIDPDDEEFGPSWMVFAVVNMVPDYDEIIRIQAELLQIAEPLKGEADGWGVML